MRTSQRLKQALDANVAALGKTGEFIRTDVAFHYELAASRAIPCSTWSMRSWSSG